MENKLNIKDPHSYHIFYFPFKWEHLRAQKTGGSFNQRHDLSTFETDYTGSKDKCWNSNSKAGWYRRRYKVDSPVQYNEYNYFYDFAREIMYDLHPDLDNNAGDIENVMHHYEYYINRKGSNTYTIQIESKGSSGFKNYELDIEDIILNVYDTGIGVFSFHLSNRKYPSQQDVLLINNKGRRLFPPFYQLDGESIGRNFNTKLSWEDGLKGVQSTEMVKSITLSLHDEAEDIVESFGTYQSGDKFQETLFHLPNHIAHFLPRGRVGNIVTFSKKDIKPKSNALLLEPVLDDRMYVQSWLGNSIWTKSLSKFYKSTEKYAYHQDELWYKYVFIDGGICTLQNQKTRTDVIDKATYARWIDYGTLYGATRYSFVSATSDLADLRTFNSAFLMQHMQSIYYKMVELVLVQRATILKFSDEVTHVVSLIPSDPNIVLDKIDDLYARYLAFQNKIYFRQVTTQEQGIELYDMLQDKMDITRDVTALDAEINELVQYASLRASQQQNKRLEQITIIGALFVIPSLVIGYFGMNLFDGSIEKHSYGHIIGMLSSASLFVLGIWLFLNHKYTKFIQFAWALLLLFLFMVCLMPYLILGES